MMAILAGVAAGLLIVIFIFSVFVASKNGTTPRREGTAPIIIHEIGSNAQKAEIAAVEREVFLKAEQVKAMADTKAIKALVMPRETVSEKDRATRFIKRMEVVQPAAAAVVPSPVPASMPALPPVEPSSDPMNETSFLKIIANKVEHVKKLSQDF